MILLILESVGNGAALPTHYMHLRWLQLKQKIQYQRITRNNLTEFIAWIALILNLYRYVFKNLNCVYWKENT